MQFHSFFGQLKDFETKTVVNNLVDNTFKHQIILSNKIISAITVPVPYIFNLLTDSRYNNAEFKWLLIDLGVSTRSTGGISQLKLLELLDDSIQLNKNIAGSANSTFEIGSTASIGSVNLDIPLGLIIFYIVPLNTSFLVYLADIDRHRAFFNNIINQVI